MSNSRIIVKNLPKTITSEKLQEIFGEKGVVTDVQLKYTKDGKFRHFGFVGYKNEEAAEQALQYFNNTFIKSSRIKVELCKELGDPNKPRAWSKYSSDSAAYKKTHDEPEKEEDKKAKVEKKKGEKKNAIIDEAFGKYENDPLFAEFLDTRMKGDKPWTKEIVEGDKEAEKDVFENSEKCHDSSVSDDSDGEKSNIAKADISDMEYLRTKTKSENREKSGNAVPEDEEKVTKGKKNKPKVEFYTVKLRGLKYNSKKKDIKKFVLPLKPVSIRLPQKMKGLAYVGFKTENEMRQALRKHKSFLAGRQIIVTKCVKSNGNDSTNSKWDEQKDSLQNEESVAESGRIFVRNLAYTVSENDIEELFSNYGKLSEVVMPVDRFTRKPKGFGIVTFLLPEEAVRAYTELDGTIFHGRMLHLLPGKEKKTLEELMEKEGLSFKEKKALQMKIQAASSHNWNTLFLGSNAVADIIAENYNTTKEKVLDPTTSESLAVRLALGETQIVSETRKFLQENGVRLDAFNQSSQERSKTVLLVKNLPAQTKDFEIHQLFVKFGELGRLLLPPSGVTAIVEFLEPFEAKTAFTKLAYTRFKNLPLYLEWAPMDTFITETELKKKKATEGKQETNEENESPENVNEEENPLKTQGGSSSEDDEEEDPEPDTTLFIKNLNFECTEDSIREHFKKCGRIHYITVAQKRDPKSPGNFLSLGYGFIQFKTQEAANKALKLYQNTSLMGHSLELKRSNRTLQTSVINARKKTQVRKQTGSKILVKNVPFQANRKELHDLFGAFGTIKHLRLPLKMAGTGTHRGFAFVEYISKHDAKRAFKDLCQSTHLYGRRLVLEWAATEEDLGELRRKTAATFLQRTSHHTLRKGTTDLTMEEDA